ncbi:BTAD domain-containing putative transcriptional regulator [Nonomuraea sp. M3C6]|uniref:BTAD domain-containing putative transcriptional regulator n=1 Tax=Nonomuraea marmarensis TaxID=3351344 RepID=A0ABW7AML5_9ACTN
MLAVLLVEAGQIVTTDRLVDELWGDKPPRTATGTVQVYVMRLRRMLEGSPVGLVTRGHGYQLVADDGAVDASLFERDAEMGRRSLASGKTRHGVGRLSEALGLWRGRPFADVPATQTVTGAAERLEHLRLTVIEDRFSGALDLGRHAEVVDELAELVQAHPFRERLHGLLMTALFRCGRRAEALAAYHRVRDTLVAEIGLEPSSELRRLHQAILTDGAEPAAPAETAHLRRLAPPTGALLDDARLPDEVTGFVGRQAELALLDLAVGRGATVVAIDGMAGVGKTALALHWAHLNRDMFSDGRLYVNLGGQTSTSPPRSADVLSRILRSFGEPEEEIPFDAERLTARYRELLAGRRTLVLLDHVRDAEQIRPLLAGVPGCVFVVTSRAPLDGLSHQPHHPQVHLDVLSPAEAGKLLEHLVGALRMSAEPEAAAELVRACAYLPLALRVAAVGVVGHPGRAIADYVRNLVVKAPL